MLLKSNRKSARNVLLLAGVFALVLSSCADKTVFIARRHAQVTEQVPQSQDSIAYSLFMIGDAGGDTTYAAPVVRGLEALINQTDEDRAGVVFLGDNIYPEGLHKKSSPYRHQDTVRLNLQLDAVKYWDGDVVVMPGNHDWDRQGDKGWKRIKRQEEYVQDYLDRGNIFLPSHGCPGPEVVKLTPHLIMIIIDTQWWVHTFDRPSGEKDGCDCRTPDELMVLFTDLLKKYRNQNVVVAAHHPLYSNGEHGGYYRFKDHMFPLTAVNDKLVIPMPGIGSIYPLYRKYIGHHQDIAHPVYQDMQRKLEKAINEYDNVVYIAGHEHNLQYVQRERIHHVISGSGSKQTYVRYNNDLDFGARSRGFARLDYLTDGRCYLSMYTTDVETGQTSLAWAHKLFLSRPAADAEVEQSVPKVSYAGQTAVVTPDSAFEASNFKRLFMGDLNRDLWTQPVTVPVLDIHYEHGGLEPIKKGGGMQTLSLRMQGGNGMQYAVRGIKKNAMFLTERRLRGTLAQDLIYDGMAGSHPYASVTIPVLADAAGVYHSNPRLVVLPDDPILGEFQAEFGGMFCLIEERPDGDMSDHAFFGNAGQVMNFREAIEQMHGHYNHRVDTEYAVRARLFDMFLGDWDRHDDQWRWAQVEEENGIKSYRPIPRDRDQAYFEFDGLFLSLANRKWTIRKFQAFDDDVRDIAGLCFNARYFDRSFLIEASREEWKQAASTLQKALTDEVIHTALTTLPPEGYAITGEEIEATLRQRRTRLQDFAEAYYEILAREVSIPGTLKDDFFEVLRREDGSVEVNVYKRKKNGKKDKDTRFYHRIFLPEETREIRLYGLDGNDEYRVKGESRRSILVRIVAGTEKDKVVDESHVRGLKRYTMVYDVEGKKSLKTEGETKSQIHTSREAVDYDRKDFVYDKLAPALSTGYNPNDGFYIGPGVRYIRHGFKLSPYRSYHALNAHYAFGAEGWHIDYAFDRVSALRGLDWIGSVNWDAPLVFPYFSETRVALDEDGDVLPARVQLQDLRVRTGVKWASQSQSQQLRVAVEGRRADVDDIEEPQWEAWESEQQDYVSAHLEHRFSNADNPRYPGHGLALLTHVDATQSVNTSDVSFVRAGIELRAYVPLVVFPKQTTLNFRTGVETNWGDFAFYQASFLNGFTNFRGVQRNRYSARTISFHSMELRSSLFKVRNYVVPFDVGFVAHIDAATAANAEVEYYSSYGAGGFVNILDAFMLIGTYSISEDDRLLTIGTRFFY